MITSSFSSFTINHSTDDIISNDAPKIIQIVVLNGAVRAVAVPNTDGWINTNKILKKKKYVHMYWEKI